MKTLKLYVWKDFQVKVTYSCLKCLQRKWFSAKVFNPAPQDPAGLPFYALRGLHTPELHIWVISSLLLHWTAGK